MRTGTVVLRSDPNFFCAQSPSVFQSRAGEGLVKRRSVAGRRRGKARAVAVSLTLFLVLTVWYSLTIVSPSLALKTGGVSDFSLGGQATVVNPGSGSATAAELSSTGNGESHVNIAIPDRLKLRQLNTLATDYKFAVGSCFLGSPRFTANVKSGTRTGSVFFYIGPSNNGGCGSTTFINSGNLAAPSSIVDAKLPPRWRLRKASRRA